MTGPPSGYYSVTKEFGIQGASSTSRHATPDPERAGSGELWKSDPEPARVLAWSTVVTPKFRSVTYFRVYLYSTLTPHTTNLPQIYFAICFRRGLLHGA